MDSCKSTFAPRSRQPVRHRAARLAAGAQLLGLLAILLPALLLAGCADRGAVLVDQTGEYGRVRVTERADGLRALYTGAGRARQSAIYPGRPGHLESEYARVAMIGLALVPRDARILFVGLGGGAMPMFVRQVTPGAEIDVVEIDPLIVELAQSHFGFRPDSLLRVHTGDGRAFIENATDASYDLVVLDAFSDDEIPRSLTTAEFLGEVRRVLAPAGVVVSNVWSSNREYPAMVATYGRVFGDAHLVRVGRSVQRIVIAAAPPRSLERQTLLREADELQTSVPLGFDLRALVERGYEGRVPEGVGMTGGRVGTTGVAPALAFTAHRAVK